MKINLILFLSLLLLLSGCTSKDNRTKVYTGNDIEDIISKAIIGNDSANKKLSGLFDLSIPLPGELNKLSVDSIKTSSGKTLFTVIVEHKNPLYNRFAIYGKDLQLFLLDKSLNGYLTLTKLELASKHLINISESFISKDTLKLERMSIYSFSDSSASLCFRSFTKLIRDNQVYIQTIDEISEDRIKTSIKAPVLSPINNKGDIFIYDEPSKSYLSPYDLFNKSIIGEIEKFKYDIRKPQIADLKSAMESVGITSEADPIIKTSNSGDAGFVLSLSETWKEIKNVSVSVYVNKEFKGTRYMNNNIGASIYVIPLAYEDSSEMYIDLVLDKKSEGNYKVRYHDKIESGKNFVQFFEYSCGNKKFLLILEASKYTFETHKQTYTDIISTFYMEC
jgi:hypothetical protein